MERYDKQTLIFLVKSLSCGIGGMEAHQRAFIKHFGNCSHIILYIATQSHEGIDLYTIQNGIIKGIGHYHDAIKGLMPLFQASTHPVIFSNDFWTLEILSKLQIKSNKGFFVIRSGGNDIEKMPWGHNTLPYERRKALCIKALMSLDAIVVNSEFSKERFRKYGIPDDKLKIIRGGVDQDICRHILSNKTLLESQLRDKIRICKPYIFTFACRFVPFKGIELALRAISSSSYKEKCHIILAGRGELEEELIDFCNKAKLNFTFLGPLSNEDVLKTIGGSHLFFNTSLEYTKNFKGHSYIHTETMGRSMMESICVHTPIICTNVGGTSELFLENDEIGIMTDCDEISISDAIESAMSQNYTFQIDVDYSWEYIFKQYVNIFTYNII